ncbi:RidA family protein [Streptomyces sp. CNQ085]|uniref:RidA family protein n=1 Tax=Streptomyces sp. CNQ085 TaxID=2886944 RepID=UPI001F513054|nr:RidA family protein [Streptomyces sp. CNQ085]MCI0385517.1 RidA family protein [Streptomyces sp. CNQ085]
MTESAAVGRQNDADGETGGDGRRLRRVRGDSPWEETIGFARAVETGDRILVAGTMPLVDGAIQGEGDPYVQAMTAFERAVAALEPFGLDVRSVVRTRMYITHARDVEDVGRAHREVFGSVRPVATLVVVSGFVDSRVLVEVEIEAFRTPKEHA